MQQQLLQIVRDLQQIAVEAIPRVLVGIAVAIALVLAAGLVERLLRALLVRIRFDALLEHAGIDKVLQRIGIRQSLNQVLPRLAYFLLLLLFARTAAGALGLTAISDGIAAMFAYLPNVIAAVLLLVVGTSVSQFAGRTVTQAAEESGIEFARSLGSLVSGLILFIVGVMAIGQLRFDTDMVRIVTVCTLSGLALPFGLSAGLGTRDITRNLMAGFYARKVFSPGDCGLLQRARPARPRRVRQWTPCSEPDSISIDSTGDVMTRLSGPKSSIRNPRPIQRAFYALPPRLEPQNRTSVAWEKYLPPWTTTAGPGPTTTSR